jgi:hypothetical protein
MGSREEWETWAQEHPPREVFELPISEPGHGPMDDYITGVCVADKAEEETELAYEAVLFQGRYYVVRKP